MSSSKFKTRIAELKRDNISGAAEILRKAILLVKDELKENNEDYKDINDLFELFKLVSSLKSEMAPLKNIWIYFVDFHQKGVPIKELADRVLSRIDQESENLTRELVLFLQKVKMIMTFSRSSTIREGLKELLRKGSKNLPELVIFESRPTKEGEKLALETCKSGYKVHYLIDAAMTVAIKKFKPDCILIGADTLFPNGNIVNKVGSYALALLARKFNIPVVVVSSTLKLLQQTSKFNTIDYPLKEIWKHEIPDSLDILNPYFEMIPGSLITGYLTEFGYSTNIPEVKLQIKKD